LPELAQASVAPLDRRQTVAVSWLEDFSDGEAFWERLMAEPTFRAFQDATRALSSYERGNIILYHAIREKQQRGDWGEWPRDATE
jgi:hypothetical protein